MRRVSLNRNLDGRRPAMKRGATEAVLRPSIKPLRGGYHKHRSSVATSTPFSSERALISDDRMYLWHTGAFIKEVEQWKNTVAASAKVDTRPASLRRLSVLVPKGEENRGKRASLDPASPFWDFFLIPESQQPSYGRLEKKTRLRFAVASLVGAALVLEVMARFASSNDALSNSWRERLLPLGFLSLVAYVVSTLAVQEMWYSPSSISTAELAQQGLLPSTYSKVDAVEICEKGSIDVDVHYLHYQDRTIGSSMTKFDAIYCNHGFGASSLSWLPVLKEFGAKLCSPHVIAHDAVGFGLTSRPPVHTIKDLYMYGLSCSAGIGLALLERVLSQSFVTQSSPVVGDKQVLLFGHSMGSLTSLRMALKLPETTTINIILVAPAVVGFRPNAGGETGKLKQYQDSITSAVSPFVKSILKLCLPGIRQMRMIFVDPPSYMLFKRLIAIKAFWRKFLYRIAWGNPETLTENNVELYRWPSIAKDCVWGVVNFLRAIPFRHGFMSYPGGDLQLLSDVLARPNVESVSIIQGTKDAIIPAANSQRLARVFPEIRLEELKGLGHDPHEEYPTLFMETVLRILKEK